MSLSIIEIVLEARLSTCWKGFFGYIYGYIYHTATKPVNVNNLNQPHYLILLSQIIKALNFQHQYLIIAKISRKRNWAPINRELSDTSSYQLLPLMFQVTDPSWSTLVVVESLSLSLISYDISLFQSGARIRHYIYYFTKALQFAISGFTVHEPLISLYQLPTIW